MAQSMPVRYQVLIVEVVKSKLRADTRITPLTCINFHFSHQDLHRASQSTVSSQPCFLAVAYGSKGRSLARTPSSPRTTTKWPSMANEALLPVHFQLRPEPYRSDSLLGPARCNGMATFPILSLAPFHDSGRHGAQLRTCQAAATWCLGLLWLVPLPHLALT